MSAAWITSSADALVVEHLLLAHVKHAGRMNRDTVPNLSFAKNASAGIALRCSAFATVMQAAEVRNLDDRSDTRDLPNMRTLLVES